MKKKKKNGRAIIGKYFHVETTICLTKDFIILSTQLSLAIEAFLDRYVPEYSGSTFLIANIKFGFRDYLSYIHIFARKNENTDAFPQFQGEKHFRALECGTVEGRIITSH